MDFFGRAGGKTTVIAIAASALSLSACRDASAPFSRAARSQPRLSPSMVSHVTAKARKIPDEYIVVFDDGVDDVHGRAAALAQITGSKIRFTYTGAMKGFAAHMSGAAAAALAKHPGVDFVEQDQEVATSETSYAGAWGIDRIDQVSLPMNGQYSFSATGAGVRAYIIDTGIRRTHTQFGGRVVPAFTSVADGYGADGCNGHGTHVAGTLGGNTVGVAKQVTLYSVRVLDCNGSGSTSGVIAGIDWVTANRVLPAVANMSLTGELSPALNAAVENSITSGVVYVVAAGNSASDACAYSPGSSSAAITVAATTALDAPASYSNSGGCVDIFAPGSTIHSAWNSGDADMLGLSGTSMAAPHVAGAAALYLETNPGASPRVVWEAIQSAATTNAISGVTSGTVNRLLRVNGPAEGTVLPPPVAPSPGAPPNDAPSAAFASSCPSQKNNCTFDGSRSRDDAGIVQFAWSFGDGTSSVTAANPVATHSYRAKGMYTVTLTVTDAAGLSSMAQKTIAVKSVSNR